ncbi:unnamed protein product [Didymodactylos carnosus]|uniref:Reverse transcriptase domain-containing protein n=1 Tax=Didymodactylos carnosus TaxID=1234261 RepID=A0A814PKP0_9BILA|nr:unnamed protein product [Didymodactylos carnosus]CAF3871995.1 unnamed protein product [Didymodactylos carnosus]
MTGTRDGSVPSISQKPSALATSSSSARDNHYGAPSRNQQRPADISAHNQSHIRPSRWHYALAYIDDIIIYSSTFEEHLIHLNEICKKLKDAKFKLNLDKCTIAKTQIEYLGHLIEQGKIHPGPNNIRGLINTRIPKTPAEASRFLKAAEYYRKFIPKFSIITEPLRKFVPTTKTEARKYQKQQITLTAEEVQAFEQLKQILTSALVLRLPNNKYAFKVQTDASDQGIGCVLLQNYPYGEHPSGYISKKFTSSQKKWSPIEQECYALICALDKWHIYLSGTKFTWETDHRALIHLKNKAQTNKRCERWRLRIAEYQIQIKHIKGINNPMPDYLSRSPVDDPEEDPDELINVSSKSTQTEAIASSLPIVFAVQTRTMAKRSTVDQCVVKPPVSTTPLALEVQPESCIIPFTLDELKMAQQNDEETRQIIDDIQNHHNYFTKNGLLLRRNTPPVPLVPKGILRNSILKIYHDTAANGSHFGRDKTLHKVRERYYWPSNTTSNPVSNARNSIHNDEKHLDI